MNYLVIARSGFVPELNISVTAGQTIPIGHPFARTLIPYSTTPDLLQDLTAEEPEQPAQDQEPPRDAAPRSVSFTQEEIDELRKLAKEAHIKNYHSMKPETLLARLEELNGI